jgi:DNA-directed RNA polymerase sigma subunit (sigma70/sigma32)
MKTKPNTRSELTNWNPGGDGAGRETVFETDKHRVVEIAGGYVNLGLSMSELVNEGYIGLLRAVGKFGPQAGSTFSSESRFWIEQSIRRALGRQVKTIRLGRQEVGQGVAQGPVTV